MQDVGESAAMLARIEAEQAASGLGPALLGVLVRAFGLYLMFQAVALGVGFLFALLGSGARSLQRSAGAFTVSVGGSGGGNELAGYAFLAIFGLAVGGFGLLLFANRIVALAYSLGSSGRR